MICEHRPICPRATDPDRDAAHLDVGPLDVDLEQADRSAPRREQLIEAESSSERFRLLEADSAYIEYDLPTFVGGDVVINLQGDMPFVAPDVLTACAGLLAQQPDCDIATVVAPDSSVRPIRSRA